MEMAGHIARLKDNMDCQMHRVAKERRKEIKEKKDEGSEMIFNNG